MKEIEHEGKKYFMCEACDMYYLTREIAQKCEDFCNKHHACNTELISKAVELGDGKTCKDC